MENTENDTRTYMQMKSSIILPYGDGSINTLIYFLPVSFHVCRHIFFTLRLYCLFNFLLLFSPNFISLNISLIIVYWHCLVHIIFCHLADYLFLTMICQIPHVPHDWLPKGFFMNSFINWYTFWQACLHIKLANKQSQMFSS